MLSQQFIDSIHNSSSGTTWFNTGIGFTSNGGQSMDYDGNNINWSNETTGNLLAGVGAELGALYFNVPVDITVPKGNSRTWNDRLNNGIDSYVMYSKFTSALWNSRLNYNRSVLANAIENTKVGQSVSAAENFMFLELPASLAGGELLAAGWRAAGIGKLICGPAGRLTGGLVKICFTEGTLVAIEKGSKKIEDIQEGDLVWSYNEETGKKELKKVVELSRNTSSSLVKISVNGTEITCTPEHPFYVNGSWVEAKDLTPRNASYYFRWEKFSRRIN